MTDAVLNITLTDAGMAAVAAAHGQGLAAKITHVAVGDAGHVPSAAAVGLQSEKTRVALTAGGPVAANQVLLQGLIPAGGQQFFIREMGYFLEDGTLLGLWSDPATPLGWIGGATPWFFKFAFGWTALPENSITVIIADDAGQAGMALDLAQLEGKVRHTVIAGGGLSWSADDDTLLTDAVAAMIASGVPDATASVAGKVELATVPEAQAGIDASRAVTPAGLAAVAATKAPAHSPTLTGTVKVANGPLGVGTIAPATMLDVVNHQGDTFDGEKAMSMTAVVNTRDGGVGNAALALYKVTGADANPQEMYLGAVSVAAGYTPDVVFGVRVGITSYTVVARMEGGTRRWVYPAMRGAVVALADSATVTPDFGAANYFSIVLGGNRMMATPANMVQGQSGLIVIRQDAVGGRTLAFSLAWKPVGSGGAIPGLTTSPNAIDLLAYYVADGGIVIFKIINNAR